MKILEICPFSAGICGVWARVRQESIEFSKLGHEVTIFSSKIEKGTEKVSKVTEEIIMNKIKIKRFKGKKSLISENVIYFFEKNNLGKELGKYDVIITHLLHPHSANVAVRINNLKKKFPKIKFFIVPHAPFNVERGRILGPITNIWRKISTLKLNNFTKIIAITKWEQKKYLINELKVKEEKIYYIPNGIPEEFFIQKKSKEKNKVLFLGRIAPVKNLEVLITSAKKLPKIDFSIVGMAEKNYLKKLESIALKNIKFYPPIFDVKEKIKLIDEHQIFVLPSKREAMPQVLIEAMSRGKIVISSNTDGGKEIIENGKNGFLFKIGNTEQLVKLIDKNIKGNRKIQENAKKSVKKFRWKNLIKKYEILFKEL